ncbi:MAG: biotin--[acetyl-CoA-carboxylase] ligase [Chitinophagales bacterium]|nr:biotin--[acetyl-CoA-carboxylase] ligase [Chitinophagales bacterium]HNI43252.1 biotin--[acetyl-CoA-carboxylase] ligase [Chitinophagales bacterium]HNL08242.1 biotin--[acetyl-CoA-carboxylase] ligase [Chitinophagales bacterium]
MEINNFFFQQATIISLDTVDSTNNYAMMCLQSPNLLPEGTTIVAKNQTAGRGQRGNEWQTTAGQNLTCSTILYPHKLLANEQFMLSQAMALAMYDFAKTILPNENVLIKWPNDLYVGQQKLGGMLIENVLQQQYLKTSIVGMGINVNQTAFAANIKNPTSLKNISKQDFDIDSLLKQLIWHISVQYFQVMTDKMAAIRQRYLSCLLGYEQWQRYYLPLEQQEVWGMITAVQNDGRLCLSTQYNGNRILGIKEVQWLPTEI